MTLFTSFNPFHPWKKWLAGILFLLGGHTFAQLFWGTFYGGTVDDVVKAMATDAAGNVYITGATHSTNFPVTAGCYQSINRSNTTGSSDVFIVKFNAAGVRQWATYIGGDASEAGNAITIDPSGNVIVVGHTNSSDFPTLNNGTGYFDNTLNTPASLIAGQDAFIVKFSSSGNLLWSTYYGGNVADGAQGVASDASGNIYIAGYTNSTNSTLFQSAGLGTFMQPSNAGGTDAFFAKFNSAGARLWGTYFGGSGDEIYTSNMSLVLNSSGDIIVSGQTNSTNLPVLSLSGAYNQAVNNGSIDGFLVRFNSSLVRTWTTYYGGSQQDLINGLAIDGANNFYITGQTYSTNFPVQTLSGAHSQPFNGGYSDAYIVKFNSSSARTWGTYLGGAQIDAGNTVTTDAANNVYVGGITVGNMPVQSLAGTYNQATSAGSTEGFIGQFNSSGTRIWLTHYGGAGADIPNVLKTDVLGSLYGAGQSGSGNLPLQNPGGGAYYQSTIAGASEGFIVKFACVPNVTITPNPASLCLGSSVTLTASGAATYTWTPATGLSSTTIANPIASPTVTTTYTVTGTSAAGCTKTASVTVTVNPKPTASAGPNKAVCSGTGVTIGGTPSANGGTSPYTYNWAPATGLSSATVANPVATPAVTTTYTLTVTDSKLCTATSTVLVTVANSPTVTAGNNRVICSGLSTTLGGTPTATGGTPPYLYNWLPVASLSSSTVANPVASPTVTTTYTLTVTDNNGCSKTSSVLVTVSVTPTPVINASPDVTICSGASTPLTVTAGSPNYTYTWAPAAGLNNPAIQNPVASPTVTTTYTVTATNSQTGSNAVVNDNFSAGNTGFTSAYLHTTDPNGLEFPIPAAGRYTINTNAANTHSAFSPVLDHTNDASRLFMIANGSTVANTDIWCSNNIPVQPNTDYEFVAYAATVYASDVHKANLNVRINGVSLVTKQLVLPPPTSPAGWEVITATWNSGSNTSVNICIKDLTLDAEGNDFALDDITFKPVCKSTATDLVMVTVIPLPVANAGSNVTICNGQSTQLNATGGTTYSWSPVTGLSNPAIANPVASPTVTTTYTVTVSNGPTCTATSTASVTIAVTPFLNVTITPPHAAICGGGLVVLTAAGGTTYSWVPAAGLSGTTGAMVTATPTVTTTYTVTATDAAGCSGTATSIVTVDFVATADAGSDVAICLGQSTQLNATGGPAYSWNPSTGLSNATIGNPVATPTVTTTYTVTVTPSGCATPSSDVVTVTVNPVPTVTVLPVNAGICPGGSVILTAAGATNYTWSPSAGLNTTTGAVVTASPTVTTTYTVTGSDANGCSKTATTVISVNPTVIANAGPNVSICLGQSTQLNATGGTGYSWTPATGLTNPLIQNPVASPTVTTTYTVTVTGPGCPAPSTASVTVTVDPLPVVAINPASSGVCQGGSVVLTATGGVSYTWQPATGLNTTTGAVVIASPTVTITYTVTATNVRGCTATATSVITPSGNQAPVIIVEASGSTIYPCSATANSITLTASGADTYTWIPATGLNTTSGAVVIATPTVTTTYTVIGTDNNGCTASSTAPVVVLPGELGPVDAGDDVTICAGGSTVLNATTANAISYAWLPNNGSLSCTNCPVPVATPTVTTTYTVTVTAVCNGNPVTGVGTVTVFVGGGFTFTVSADHNPACAGSTVHLAAIPSPAGSYSYTWSPSGGLNNPYIANPTATPAATTVYTVTVSNNSCTVGTTYTLSTIATYQVYAGEDITLCTGGSNQLHAIGAAGGSFLWSPATGLSNPSVANPTVSGLAQTTTYTVTYTNGGCQSTDEVIVHTAGSIPSVSAGADKTICPGNTVQLAATGGVTYSWSPITGLSCTNCAAPLATPGSTTTYTVTARDQYGCTVTDNVIVNVSQLTFSAGSDVTVCPGGQATIGNIANTTTNSYIWSPVSGIACVTCPETQASPITTTTYTLTALNGNCTTQQTVTVTVDDITGADFSFTVDAANPGQVNFIAQPLPGTGRSYQWNFGDGYVTSMNDGFVIFPAGYLDNTTTGTYQSPVHVYKASGTYNVCLYFKNNCGTKQVCKTVTVDIPCTTVGGF